MEKEMLTPQELAIIDWQFSLHGGFKKTLFEAICIADDDNLDKLYLGFPYEVSGFRKYTYKTGWWKNTVAKAKRIGYLPENAIR